MIVAHRSHATRRLLFVAGLVFGFAMTAVVLAPTLGIAFAIILVMGAGQMTFMGANNSMVQLGSDPQMRGRVMAVYTIAVLGTTPIGGPFIGWLSSVTNPRCRHGGRRPRDRDRERGVRGRSPVHGPRRAAPHATRGRPRFR